MNNFKLLSIITLLIFALVGGVLVCKHTTKKTDDTKIDVTNSKVKKQKKPYKVKKFDTLSEELHRQHMMDMFEYRALRFGPAGKSIEDLDATSKEINKIYIQTLCVEGFKWVMFAGVYNGKITIDVEQMEGYDGPVSCH